MQTQNTTNKPNLRKTRAWQTAAAFIAVTLLLWLKAVSPLGDISNNYTDHLRHMGEALAILDSGWATYRVPYASATAHIRLPCPEHRDLWGAQVSLYPPLGLLMHAPIAVLERDGHLSAGAAHKLIGLFWFLIGIASVLASAVLLRGQPLVARLGLFMIAAPLLLGTGANAFFDVGFVLPGIGGLIAFRRARWPLATVLFACSGAMHFRAVVLLPFALAALVETVRSKQEPATLLFTAATCALLLLPSVYAAHLVAGFASSIEAHNPAHYLHHGSAFWLSCILSVAAAAFIQQASRASAVCFLLCGLLIALDPMHAWWHALVIVLPVLSLAAEAPRPNHVWALAWVWSLAMGFTVFRHALGPYWQWLAFALHRAS